MFRNFNELQTSRDALENHVGQHARRFAVQNGTKVTLAPSTFVESTHARQSFSDADAENGN
jgi:hypothetical protein